ncbi:MAG: DUF59 domain-containing protein, partial [Xanthomonadales bacterium]|nr:DUF59 domain-containing protein [Xanthomonadales bacterium]
MAPRSGRSQVCHGHGPVLGEGIGPDLSFAIRQSRSWGSVPAGIRVPAQTVKQTRRHPDPGRPGRASTIALPRKRGAAGPLQWWFAIPRPESPMSEVLKERVRAVLARVQDPHTGNDLVSSGAVRGIGVD